MNLNSFEDLLTHKLRELYDAETQFVEAQPKLAAAAEDEELRVALEAHLEVTKGQIERLVQLGNMFGVTLEGETCEAAKALVKEGLEIVRAEGDPFVKDAALIAAAQAIEHFEIAGYGTASAYVRRLGNKDMEKLLEQTLAEERGADTLLTEIAEASINPQAAS